jgi:hypothetical protein
MMDYRRFIETVIVENAKKVNKNTVLFDKERSTKPFHQPHPERLGQKRNERAV